MVIINFAWDQHWPQLSFEMQLHEKQTALISSPLGLLGNKALFQIISSPWPSDLFGVLLMLRQSSHCCYRFWMCPRGPAGTGGWWLCSSHTFWGLYKPWVCHHSEWTMTGEFGTWTMEVRQERESISNAWGDAKGQWDWDGINTDVPLKKKKNLCSDLEMFSGYIAKW